MNNSQHNGQAKTGNLRDIFNILFRQRWKIILFFSVVFLTAGISTYFAPNIYRSEAKLLIRLGRESVTLDPTATTGRIMHISQTRQEEINSEMQILQSHDIAKTVVHQVGTNPFLYSPQRKSNPLKKAFTQTKDAIIIEIKNIFQDEAKVSGESDMTDLDLAVMAYEESRTVEAQNLTNILVIAYDSPSPLFAERVVKATIAAYLTKHIDARNSSGSYDFFVGQTDALREELEDIELRLSDAKRQAGIASISEQQRIVMQRIERLQQDQDKNKSELIAARSRVEVLQTSMENLPSMIENEKISGTEDMRTELYRLQLREQELLSKYAPESIQVQEIQRQIAAAKELLTKEPQVTMGVNTTYQQLKYDLLRERSNLSGLELQAKEVENQLVDARWNLDNLNRLEAVISRLEREKEIKEANYKKYSENLEEARIGEALQTQQISNISVIQEATRPTEPIKPNKMLNILIAFVVGMSGGIGWAFFAENIDHSIKTPEDVEKYLQLRTLAVIPKTNHKKKPTLEMLHKF